MEDVIEKIIGERIFDEKDDKTLNLNFFKHFEQERNMKNTFQEENEVQMLSLYLKDNVKLFEIFGNVELTNLLKCCDIINFKKKCTIS